MKKQPSVAQLTRAVKRASKVRAARLTTLLPNREQRLAIRQLQNGTTQVVAQHLIQSGLDLKKIKTLQKQLGVELAREAVKHKAAALRLASAQKRNLNSAMVRRSKAASALASGPALNLNPFVVLDTPFLIWPQPLLAFSDSNTAPFGSWVKFNFSNSNSEGTQSVNFYYYWQNPFTNSVTINAETFLSAVGHLQANANWGLASHAALVGVVALFDAWIGAPPIGTTPPQLDLGEARALASFLTGGDSNGTAINSDVTLTKTMVAVPSLAGVMFEVSLAVYYYSDDGANVDADFASGDFRFANPFVAFSILNAPNPAWGVNVAPVALAD